MRTIISSQSLFADLERALEVLGILLDKVVVGVETFLEGLGLVPGLIVMDIHYNVFHAVISKEVILACVFSVNRDNLSIVEHKLGLRRVFLELLPIFSIPIFENWVYRVNLKFIY